MGLNHGWRGPNIVRDGLVLYLDAGSPNSYQGTGTTWKDISKFYQNNGTLINGPTFSSDNGGSIVFDKTNNRVQRDFLNLGNNFTLGIWAKPTVNSRQTLVANSYTYLTDNNGNNGFFWTIGNSSGQMFLSLGQDKYYRFSQSNLIQNNTWFYGGVSYDGTTIRLYFNGNDVSSSAVGSPINIVYGTNPLFIGGWNINGTTPIEFFGGSISTVQIYNRALSAQEVLQNYNATKGRFGL